MNYEVTNFDKDVIEASFSKPVLVDFWAEWCGPCRILGPVLERLASKSNNWKLAKVNTDLYPEASSRYGIRSIPNVKLFHNGKVINEFVGALPEKTIVEWLNKNIPNKFDVLLRNAETLISHGRDEEAKKILERILKEDSNNTKAKIILAKIYLFTDGKRSQSLVDNIEPTDNNADILNSIKIISELLNDDKIASRSETPTKNIFLQAAAFLKEKQFDLSLEKFIEIIRTDRFYEDDIARIACIAIFKFLGEENEITLKYRRDFGSALYV